MEKDSQTVGHTPGPWKVQHPRGIASIQIIARKRTVPIALVYTRRFTDSEDEANANMLAAAPELLETVYRLRTAMHALYSLHNDSEPEDVEQAHDLYNNALRKAEQVIAKTEGKRS